jgi:hypothetical protein
VGANPLAYSDFYRLYWDCSNWGGNCVWVDSQYTAKPNLDCPPTVEGCRNNPKDWNRYPERSGEEMFHCGFECYNENTDNKPRNQCCYNSSGELSTGMCKGTPDFNSCDEGMLTAECIKHLLTDPGGVLWSGPAGAAGTYITGDK